MSGRGSGQPGSIEYYRKALAAIEEGRGRFSRDQLEFAGNVIEAMKKIAHDALNHKWESEP